MTDAVRPPCALDHTVPGRHIDGCVDPTCTGCQHATAGAESLACRWHERRALDTIRALPGLWADLGDTRTSSAGGHDNGSGSSDGPALPLSDTRRDARERIRLVLADWTLTVHRAWGVSLPPGTVRAMAALVATWTPRILAHPAHAEQLLGDLLGHYSDSAVDDEPVWHSGPLDARRLLERPGANVRLLCSCGHRIPLDPEVLKDPTAMLTCGSCGETGVLAWWRTREAPESVEPLALSELAGWLLVHRRLDVTTKALRHMHDRGRIAPVAEHRDTCHRWITHPPDIDAEPCPGCRRPARYDPIAVAAILTTRR